MKFDFNINGLYKRTPKQNETTRCRNFTYRPYTNDNGETWHMVDTYYDDYNILVTENNVHEFEFIFDFNDVKRIDFYYIADYEEKDIFHVPVDSGGLKLAPYFVRKGAEKSIPRIIAKITEEIKSLERQLEWKKKELICWSIEIKNE